MRSTACLVVLILTFAGLIHFAPEAPLSAEEIQLHQIARDIIHHVPPPPDRLLGTRGRALAQVRIIPAQVETRAAVEIDWPEVAAMMAVLGAIYAFVTKLVVGPMLDRKLDDFRDANDKRYVSAEKFNDHREALNALLEHHINTDDKNHEQIARQLDQIWQRLQNRN